MPSSDGLPRPPEWPEHDGGRYKAALVFVMVLGLACVVAGFGFVAIGRAAGLKYALLLAALFLLSGAFGFVTRMRPRHRAEDIALTTHEDGPATEIRYSGAAFAILSGLLACLAAICVLAAVDFLGAEVPAAAAGAVLCGIAALFFLSFFALVAAGRIQRGRLVLTQRGIHQRGRAFTSFLPWEAVAGAKAAYNGTPEVLVIAYANSRWERQQLGTVWKLDKLPPVPMIEIDTTSLAVDPNLVYHLVRFYVDNPDARAELGTETSLQRARTGTF